MEPRPLLVVLAAVFAGLAMVLTVAAAVTGTWLVLMGAVPLALTAGLMWYQGTGRLAAGLIGGGTRRRRRRRHTGGPRTTAGRASSTHDRRREDDPWEEPFRAETRREARHRRRRRARQRTRRERAGGEHPGGTASASASAGTEGARRARQVDQGGLTAAEAYDVLGLDRAAGEAAVREAYREKAKVLHPDTEGGSAEAFQELTAAYERLVGD